MVKMARILWAKMLLTATLVAQELHGRSLLGRHVWHSPATVAGSAAAPTSVPLTLTGAPADGLPADGSTRSSLTITPSRSVTMRDARAISISLR
ncbi:MAG: hypothetical protein R2838_03495 [Caldilineaceae bacterium]